MPFNLRNEIFEGIAAYKALAPTTQDRYYEEVIKEKQRSNKRQDEADEKARKAEADRRANPNVAVVTGAPPAPNVPTKASTAAPGSAPTTAPPVAPPSTGGGIGGGGLASVDDPFARQPQMASATSVMPDTLHPIAKAILDRSIMQGRHGGRVPNYQDGGLVSNYQDGGVAEPDPASGDAYSAAADQLMMTPMPGQPSLTDRMRGMSRVPVQTPIPTRPPLMEPDPDNPHYATRPAVYGPPENTVGEKVKRNVRDIADTVQQIPKAIKDWAAKPELPGTRPSPELSAPTPGIPARPPFPLPLEQASPEPPPAALNPSSTPFTSEVTPNVNQLPGPSTIPQTSAPTPGTVPTAKADSTSASPSGQGQGNGQAKTPPPGAASANTPTGATKPGASTGVGTAPGPGGTRVAPGSLQDQNRVDQYDPAKDALDPTNARPVDASGQAYTQQQLDQLMGAAMQAAPVDPNGKAPPVGTGAISRPVYKQFIASYNDAGRLNEGQALLAGMMARYQVYLKYGMVQEAGMMAWSVMQAANVEAAAFGRMARDQLMGGDPNGAKQSIVQAVNILPDGMQHSLSPDGQFLLTTDPATGKTVGRTPMGGKQIIALAMGIGDGSAMWAALQNSVTSLKALSGKPDLNAEGRGLSNQIKRNQLLLQQQRLKKGAGGGAGAGKTNSASMFDNLRGNMSLTGNAARDGAVTHVYNNNSDFSDDSSAADSGNYDDG